MPVSSKLQQENGEKLMMLSKLLELFKACPTCGKGLVSAKGTTILHCPDLFHGRFVIERTTKGGFFITYEPSKRSVS
jgi:hypothetical protein